MYNTINNPFSSFSCSHGVMSTAPMVECARKSRGLEMKRLTWSPTSIPICVNVLKVTTVYKRDDKMTCFTVTANVSTVKMLPILILFFLYFFKIVYTLVLFMISFNPALTGIRFNNYDITGRFNELSVCHNRAV